MSLSRREYLLLLWASGTTIVIIVSYLLKHPAVRNFGSGTQCQCSTNIVQSEAKVGINRISTFTRSKPKNATVELELENHSSLLRHYESKLFHSDIDLSNEKCTMIMLTYKRESILPELLTHYCRAELLKKIIVIWNDVDTELPNNILSLSKSCETTLVFIKEKENKLTNRFKPRAEIETDCVMSIDDDRKVEDLHDLDFAFRVWQEFRQRLVGYESRTHTTKPDGSYFYGVYNHMSFPGNSMMLTSSCFLHKVYLELYHDPNVMQSLNEFLEFINSDKNCEDISMNMIVAKFLRDIGMPQPTAIQVNPKGKVMNLEGVAVNKGAKHRGLSMRSSHYTQRSECINALVKKFFNGHMPLLYTRLSFTRH